MSEFEKVDGVFDFEVGLEDWGSSQGNYFTVRLPHQCDSWEVTSNPNRETAIADLEAFISQAQTALEKLRRLEKP